MIRKKHIIAAIIVYGLIIISLSLFIWGSLSYTNVPANEKDNRSDTYVYSDKKLEESEYEYELAYQLLDEDKVKYIYFIPTSGDFQSGRGTTYEYFNCKDLTININSGTCFVEHLSDSFITTSFSLKQIN